ncbi:hypothetical protein B0H34DRAFT_411350 [Crassisporium funariophilum]|nr:hypothetical protein B0H34DRAFT_411350 [Crassisporium funariophilum]
MSNSTPDTAINISLEPHLADTLTPLLPVLPQELADQLAAYVTEPRPALIPYSTLFAVSQWARTSGGEKALDACSLKIHDYTMISLLAGTTTSPERKFGAYLPPKEPEEIEALRISVAFAAWWAADKTGWNNEWRVLFALFAAILVAIAEAGLYLIYQSRKSKSKSSRMKKRSARHKKVDSGDEVPPAEELDSPKAIKDASDETSTTLRHRR